MHEEMVAANACMFGACGAAEVLAFKRGFLTASKNYEAENWGCENS